MRRSEMTRTTNETRISVAIDLDGPGSADVRTPIGFLNHVLSSFALHGRMNVTLAAEGDTQVDQHHLVEDCGIVLGQAVASALGTRAGIARAGFFTMPMDESLVTAAVDLSGRGHVQFRGRFKRRFCGDLDTDLIQDLCEGFARGCECTLAIDIHRGRSDHHKIEALFKALGRALRMACTLDPDAGGSIPSTKGVL